MNVTISKIHNLESVLEKVTESYDIVRKYSFTSPNNVNHEEILTLNKTLVGMEILLHQPRISNTGFYIIRTFDWVETLRNLINCFKISDSVTIDEREAKHLLEIIKFA